MDRLNGDALAVIQLLKIIHENVCLFVSVHEFQSVREHTNIMKNRCVFSVSKTERYSQCNANNYMLSLLVQLRIVYICAIKIMAK
jgi:hypothetical protein